MGMILEEIRVKKDKRFRQFRDEAIKRANEIFEGSKNSDYNSGGVRIFDYFDLKEPVLVAFSPCWRKALREKSLICSNKEPQNESLLDTIVDHINYLSFLFATIKMEE